MKRKKVLHVLRSNIYAGAESIAVNIIESLAEEYEFIYSCPKGQIAEILEKKQISYEPMQHFNVAEVKRIIDLVQPDIVHAHDYSASIACAIASHGKRIVISHLHHDSPECRSWGKKALLYAVAVPFLERIIVVSKATVDGTVFEKMIARKTVILENPVDRKKIREMAEVSEQVQYDLIYVGRLSEKKNPLRFIEIVKLLCEKGLNIKAAMIGNGELYEACNALIKQEKLEQNVTLLGYKENPYSYMKSAKIFCMTSVEEGYGLAVMEAVSLGLPVLVTPVGNMKDVFQKEEEICMSNTDFCQKAEMLLKEPEIYAAWKTRMEQYADKIMAPSVYMEKLKEIYGE